MPFQLVKLTDPINITNLIGGATPRGNYDNSTDYAIGDIVSYTDGSSYIMYTNGPAGTLPTDGDYWSIIAEKGDAGNNGTNGDDGDAATISVGAVNTVGPSDPATVTNSGTTSAAVFDFEIPQGEPGADGNDGADGVVQSIVAGNNIDVNSTDPANPVVSVETLTLSDVSDITASATEVNYTDGVTSGIQTQLDNKQPLDADLTTIAGLTATTDNFMVAASNAWASRTPAQAKSALALVKGDVGLSNVDNTSDATKNSATATLTNKRITKRSLSSSNDTTFDIDVDAYDYAEDTGLTGAVTVTWSGTPTVGQTLWVSITGTAARGITWDSDFEASTVALPTTTVSTDRLDVGFIWNAATSKFRCVAVA